MRILIAEDDESIMTSYKLLLRSRKHELFTASDGEECLMIFEKIMKQDQTKSRSDSPKSTRTPFDVVILDYRMPKKDGLQVARQILSVAPDQRIIIASAYTHELLGISSVEMLQKPFGFDVLLRLVEGAPEPPQRNIGKESSTSEGRMPSTAEFNSEKDRLDDERFTRMYGRSDDFLEPHSSADVCFLLIMKNFSTLRQRFCSPEPRLYYSPLRTIDNRAIPADDRKAPGNERLP